MKSTLESHEAGAADVRETAEGGAQQVHPPPHQARIAGADPGQGPGDVEAPTVVGQPQGTEVGRSPDNHQYRGTGTRPC
jgi:hypothetical protein